MIEVRAGGKKMDKMYKVGWRFIPHISIHYMPSTVRFFEDSSYLYVVVELQHDTVKIKYMREIQLPCSIVWNSKFDKFDPLVT